MKSFFGSLFGAIGVTIFALALTIIGSTVGLMWYVAKNFEPVAVPSLFAGVTLAMSIWIVFKFVDFLSDTARGWQETARFKADQESDYKMLQAQSGIRNNLLQEQIREATLNRRQLQLAQQVQRLEEPEDDEDAVVVEGNLWD